MSGWRCSWSALTALPVKLFTPLPTDFVCCLWLTLALLSSCAGRMFMTTDGTIVLRVCSRGLLTTEYDCITEDYLTLEEDGEVLVDKMCALHVRATEAPQQLTAEQHSTSNSCQRLQPAHACRY